MAHPFVEERPSHGSPGWFVKGKKLFVTFVDDHHGDDPTVIWAAAPFGAQPARIEENPEVFFRPPYVGHRGWIGMMMSGVVDWELATEVIDEAYDQVCSGTKGGQA